MGPVLEGQAENICIFELLKFI